MNTLKEQARRRFAGLVAGLCAAVTIASCGGGNDPAAVTGGEPPSVGGVEPTSAATSVDVLFSTAQLRSADVPGGRVTVMAHVTDGGGAPQPNVAVQFSADSGMLSSALAVTDNSGVARTTLGTGGDTTNRTIHVIAQAGALIAGGAVPVTGTSLMLRGPSLLAAGNSGDYQLTLRDSAGTPVANTPVTIRSDKGNPISIKTSNGGTAAAPLTNYEGLVVFRVVAQQSGNDRLTATAQGTTATADVSVNPTALSLSLANASGQPVAVTGNGLASAATGACTSISVGYFVGGIPQSGSVSLTTSLGGIYADAACSVPLTAGSVPLQDGRTQAAYLRSDRAGTATVSAIAAGGVSTRASIEFVAALGPRATLTMSSDVPEIGNNLGSSDSERSVLTALVQDGTPFANPVANAMVEFSLASDPSGGVLLGPTVVATDATGMASVVYAAGPRPAAGGTVSVQAKLQGTNTAAIGTLSVAANPLSVSAGTHGEPTAPSSTTYRQDYVVIVSDASGNPVPGVAVTASAIATRYAKGVATFDAAAGQWTTTGAAICPNEDANRNGALDAAEDFNGNGALDPGLAFQVSSSGATDAAGKALVSLLYPRDRAAWLEVQLLFVAGAAQARGTARTAPYFLPAIRADVADPNMSPPGAVSPYGVADCSVPQ